MRKLYLEVVTPQRRVVSQEIDLLVAPGSLGQFGVLEGHEPFLSGIEAGELLFTSHGQTDYYFVSSGFIEVSENMIALLADAAEKASEIDVGRAEQARARALDRLEKGQAGEVGLDLARAEAALKRATGRIGVAARAR